MAGVYVETNLKRFFVDKIDKPLLKLTGNEYRHLADVLRARAGDAIVLCPNDGRDYEYEITSIDKVSATLRYVRDYPNVTETNAEVTAFVALLKGDKTELAVQKLTELGVRRIVPFISEFTVQRSEKTERLKRAAHEASKQCGRAIIPEVSDVVTFDKLPPMLGSYDGVVFAYEGAYADGDRLGNAVSGDERSVAMIVGPEGGFSEKEVRMLVDAGYKPVTLGKRILRAETASIACAAVIMNILGEWE